MQIFNCISYLIYSHLSPLGLLIGAMINSYCLWSPGLYWFSLLSYHEYLSLESLSGSASDHKYDTGSYAQLLSPESDW